MAQCRQGTPAPIVVRDESVVMTGGHLSASHEVSVAIRLVGPCKFWMISTHCPKACQILSGQAACHRPLSGLKIWTHIKKAVVEMRSEQAVAAADGRKAAMADAEEDKFSFGGEACGDMETPEKKRPKISKKKTGFGTQSEKPTLFLDMPRYFGQDEPRISVPVINCTKVIGIAVEPHILQWLVEYIHAERTEGCA
jgi:hypothetical protein